MIDYGKSDQTDPLWAALTLLVARLEGLPGFPFGTEAKRELCFALANANSLQEATFIVDQVLQSDTTERCPTPPDIRRMLNAEHTRAQDTLGKVHSEWQRQLSNFRCRSCQDFGIAESIDSGNIKSVASYCKCEHGQSRRQMTKDDYSPEIVNAARAKLLSIFPNLNGIESMISSFGKLRRIRK